MNHLPCFNVTMQVFHPTLCHEGSKLFEDTKRTFYFPLRAFVVFTLLGIGLVYGYVSICLELSLAGVLVFNQRTLSPGVSPTNSGSKGTHPFLGMC